MSILTVQKKHIKKRNTYVPRVDIAGKYLTECGFTTGAKVDVELYKGMIVIKLKQQG